MKKKYMFGKEFASNTERMLRLFEKKKVFVEPNERSDARGLIAATCITIFIAGYGESASGI